MAESIDVPLLRVPFESLKRTSRDRKYVIDDVQAVVAQVEDAAKLGTAPERAAALAELASSLLNLKRKLEETSQQEEGNAHRCSARLQHLRSIGNPQSDAVLEWTRQRLPRILVDQLLRSGYVQTAKLLVEKAELQDLVDAHIFEDAQDIIHSLQRHDCGPALVWCAANKPRLKKAKSKLEFKLRVQEFIELVRSGNKLAAIKYSKQHLAPWAGHYGPEMQRTIAALVFGAETGCLRYRELFDESQWKVIIDLFYLELFRLNNLTPESLLSIHLQAGLSALKSPQGATDHSSKDDPLHSQNFKKLAEGLPYAKHVHSRLVCAITKEIMNEHNPPVVLPNGIVYSKKAIQQNSNQGDGIFVDPISGDAFELSDMRRAFIS